MRISACQTCAVVRRYLPVFLQDEINPLRNVTERCFVRGVLVARLKPVAGTVTGTEGAGVPMMMLRNSIRTTTRLSVQYYMRAGRCSRCVAIGIVLNYYTRACLCSRCVGTCGSPTPTGCGQTPQDA